MKEYNLEGFERGLFELGITLSEEQKTQFLQYYELLVEWNSFMNLTAITEFDQVITKHFLDSLSLVKVCDVAQAGRILDVGTGSGILAVAGVLLGAKRALGVDIDELSVKTAKENAKLNGVSDKTEFIAGNLTDKVSGRFNLVTANIVADVIMMLNEDILKFLSKDGIYIMSGIIDTRENDVLENLEGKFEVLEILRERGWTAIAAKPL